jgi:hypothetical protein
MLNQLGRDFCAMTVLTPTDTHPASPMLFLSYSRNEIYFAEAVVKALQAAGITVWFDLQRLETGTEWAASIQSGIDQSQGLVLIASRGSLDSIYVADEWEAMLKRGLPIYVVLFEAASFQNQTKVVNNAERKIELETLPAQAACVIDCRAGFDQNMARLIACIKGEAVHKDAVPRVLPLNLPTRVPLAVGMVALALAAHLALIIFGTLALLTATLPSFLLGVTVSFLLGYQLYEFLVRYIAHEVAANPANPTEKKRWVTSFQYNQIRWSVVGGFFSCIMFYNPLTRGTILVMLLLFIALILLHTSPALLRWAPRGQAPRILRHGMRPARRIPSYPPDSSGKKYQIYANEADKHVAGAVRRAMKRAGHVEGWHEDGVKTDFRLMIASNYTQDADIAVLKDTQDTVVVVFASGLASTALTDPFVSRQQTDWRTRNMLLLNKMAVELRDDVPAIQDLSVYLTPLDFRQHVLPASVVGVRWLIFMLGGLFTLLGGLTAGTMIAQIRAGDTSDVRFIIVIFGVLISVPLLLGILLIYLTNRIVKREVTVRRFLTFIFLPTLLLGLLGMAATGLIVLLPFLLIWIGWNIFALRLWLPAISRHDIPFWGWWHYDRELLQSSAYKYITTILFALTLAAALVQYQTPTITSVDVPLVEVVVEDLQFSVPEVWLQVPVHTLADITAFGERTDNPLMRRLINAESTYAGRIERLVNPENGLNLMGELKWVGLYAPSTIANTEHYLTVWQLNPGKTLDDLLNVSQVNNPGWELLAEAEREQAGTHITEWRFANPNPAIVDIYEVWYVTLDTAGQDYFMVIMARPRMVELDTEIMERVIQSITTQDSE